MQQQSLPSIFKNIIHDHEIQADQETMKLNISKKVMYLELASRDLNKGSGKSWQGPLPKN